MTLILSLSAPLSAFAGKEICYEKDVLFSVNVPDGWINDTEAARNSRNCLVLYPLGEFHSKSPVVINLRFLNLRSRKLPLEKGIERDIQNATIGAPGNARIETEPDFTNANGITFIQKRIFKKFGNPFEARAYAKFPEGLQVVMITRPQSDYVLYEGAYKTLLSQMSLIKKENLFNFLSQNATDDSRMPAASGYGTKFLNSIGKPISESLKHCHKNKGDATSAVIRVSEAGEIMDWFDQGKSQINDCMSKRLVGKYGTKAPFGPFHIVLDLKSYLKNFARETNTLSR